MGAILSAARYARGRLDDACLLDSRSPVAADRGGLAGDRWWSSRPSTSVLGRDGAVHIRLDEPQHR